ncbi:MAG: rhodanese-like domain-containing protein, partial [Alphaproteobacteria bacterium]
SLFPKWGVANRHFVADVLAVVGRDRNAPIALICASGRRSGYARDLLAKNGFTRVYSIAEGMAGSARGPGWLARGLPVEPCDSC